MKIQVMKKFILTIVFSLLAFPAMFFAYHFAVKSAEKTLSDSTKKENLYEEAIETLPPKLPVSKQKNVEAPDEIDYNTDLAEGLPGYVADNKSIVSYKNHSSHTSGLHSVESDKKRSGNGSATGSSYLFSFNFTLPVSTSPGYTSVVASKNGLSQNIHASHSLSLNETAPENSYISPGDSGSQKLPGELHIHDGLGVLLLLAIIFMRNKKGKQLLSK